MGTSSLQEMLNRIEARERLLERIANPNYDNFDDRADHEYDRLRDRRDEEEYDENSDYSEDDAFNGE